MIWFRIRRFVRAVLSSFWFWPLVFIVFAVYLSGAIADAARGTPVEDVALLRDLVRGAQLYASPILTATAAADVTVLTFVFSTLMVVLQLASNQLSPRILRTTVREGRAQLTMAIMVGGFVFSLYSLLSLYEEEQAAVGAFLVAAAVIWTVIIVLTFLYFVGYTVSRIRAPSVIRSVGDRAARDIRRMYGMRPPAEGATVPEYSSHAEIMSDDDGVLTGVGWHALVQWAKRNDALIELDVGLGDHVSAGVTIGRVSSERAKPGARAVRRALVIESERTLRGDPPYGFRLLEDIGIRALSPAVNDPTTAVQVLDELENLLVLLAERPERPGRFYDRDGVLRLRVPAMSWADYLRLAVQEIYEYGRDSSQVTQKIARMLENLANTTTGERRAAVEAVRQQITVIPRMIPDVDHP